MATLIPGESQQEYDAHVAAYIQQFQPANGVESDLLQTMAVARWRLRRIPGIEANMIANEIVANPDVYQEYSTEHQQTAWAFDRCSHALSLLTRYEATLNRTFERAWKQLQSLQSARFVAESEKLRNENAPARSSVEHRAESIPAAPLLGVVAPHASAKKAIPWPAPSNLVRTGG